MSVMVLDSRKSRKPSMLVLSPTGTLNLLLLLLLLSTVDGGATSASSCLRSEASILLHIKEGLHLSNGRLSSWGGNESNCCLWEAVECDPQTGRIIGLQLHGRTTSESTSRVFMDISGSRVPPALFELHQLQHLDLSGCDFNGSAISSQLAQLTHLTHLNLSRAWFSGQVPWEISKLSNLVSLDLSHISGFHFDVLDDPYNLALEDLEGFVENFKHLKHLHMDYVRIKLRNSQSWSISLSTALPNLLSLSLASCGLHGSHSPHIFRLPHLQALDLSDNLYLNGTLMPSYFPPKSSLQSLRLAGTRLSGHLPHEVFELPLLNVLDLSNCDYVSGPLPTRLPKSKLQILRLHYVTLSGELPSWIGNLTSLVELDLSYTNLSGSIPVTIGNLTSLVELDLQDTNLSGSLPVTIGNLTSLIKLDLSDTHLSGSLPITIGNLKCLTSLDLSFTSLSGILPATIGNLAALTYLKLSHTGLSSNLPITMANLTALTYLDLSSTSLSGSALITLDNLTALRDLDLSATSFSGRLPIMLGRFTTLSHLDLRGCKFTSIDSSLFANLTHLTYLDLSENTFSGLLPSLPYHLSYVTLNDNNFSGPIPNSYNLHNIETLDLSSNSLTGTLPSSLTHGPSLVQSPLQHLDLSNNRFHGYLNLGVFANLKNLQFLSLSRNNWTVDVHDPTLKFPSLQDLSLVSCNIIELPQFLRHHKPIDTLDLSKNMISGEIPKWLGLSSSLSISYNKITSIEEGTFLNIEQVDLSYNMLNRLPKFLSPSTSPFDNMVYFSIKNNSVTGEIPASLCNFTILSSLDLSNNKFSGRIPDCFLYVPLNEVKLQNNQLQGQIPEFGCQTGTGLRILDLSDNRFVGYIPTSLGNCKNLEFINLGYNKLSGEFPWWLAKLPELKILVLRSNSLNGAINFTFDKNAFQELLVLDISTNQFAEKLPLALLLSLNAMKYFSPDSFIPSFFKTRSLEGWGLRGSSKILSTYNFLENWEVTLSTKGINLTYERGTLSIMKTIDVSNNHFEGEISDEIGDLKGLQALRISNNKLKGPIPKSIGALSHLESLDLSHNYLSGEIPEELTTLNSLGYLNLSYNKLSGRIPQSPHFSTFDNLSFEGNPSLCGPPLSLACEANNGATLFPFVGLGEREEETMWKYISMGLGFGAGFGTTISFSYFLNNRRGFNSFWRRCYWSCA